MPSSSQILEFCRCEVRTVVRDDVVWYPNLKMIDLIKFTAVRAVELVMGTASIHLVNLSTATSRCVLPAFDDFLSGPTMSSPQVANGHDIGMVLSSEAGACGLLSNF